MCEGFRVPTLDEVKEAAPGLGVDAETAEDFWTYYDAIGWNHKGSSILNWHSLLKIWQRARKRLAAADSKREKRIGNRRKADNNVEMSDEVREEVRRDFDL